MLRDAVRRLSPTATAWDYGSRLGGRDDAQGGCASNSNFKTAADITSRSRRMFCARFSFVSRPLQSEGAGNAGRPMRPIAACAMIVVERTRVSQVTPESPGIPHAMVLTASCVLSPVSRAFLPPSPPLLSANLTPASGCQDHTPSPSADKRRRLRHHPRPPHPAPRFVTLRNAPLSGRDDQNIAVICISEKQNIFAKGA
jgi:hypothetical protein